MDRPKWKTAYYAVAEKEARKFLNDDQLAYAVQQIEAMAHEENPRMPSPAFNVKGFGPFGKGKDKIKFFELRDKGGILGRINLRTFFGVDDKRKLILVLSFWNKKVERQTPVRVVRTMKNRLRNAIETDFRVVR